MVFLKAAGVLLFVARLASCAVPNVSALGSDLTILSDNDLYCLCETPMARHF